MDIKKFIVPFNQTPLSKESLPSLVSRVCLCFLALMRRIQQNPMFGCFWLLMKSTKLTSLDWMKFVLDKMRKIHDEIKFGGVATVSFLVNLEWIVIVM